MSKSANVFALAITLSCATALQAEGIVEAHIKAVGGKDSIAKIKTVHRTGTISGESGFGPLSGNVEEILDLSKNRAYTSMEITGYSREEVWTGDSGWMSDTQAGVTAMPADEASFAKYNGGPSPLVAIHAEQGASLKEIGEKEFNGKKCSVVTAEGFPGEFLVNQATKLLEGVSIPGNVEVTYEDYKAVEGVQFAGKTTMKIEAQNITMVYEYKTTKVNGKVDEAKFKKPSGLAQVKESTTPSSESFTAKQIISYLDKNGDGKIAKDEASEELKSNFQFIDTNGDGIIDLKEAEVIAKYAGNQQAGSTAPAAATGPVTAKQILSSMDANRDGKISKDEASEDLKLFFEDIDANGDGVIDLKEAEVMAKYANEQQGQ